MGKPSEIVGRKEIHARTGNRWAHPIPSHGDTEKLGMRFEKRAMIQGLDTLFFGLTDRIDTIRGALS